MFDTSICAHCQAPLSAEQQRRHSKYCTKKCRNDNARMAIRAQHPGVSVEHSNATKGAIGELMVATDLMRLGFHVFRALSHNCECDLIAMYKGRSLRVEVTTGVMSAVTGTISYPPHDRQRYDLLAIVLPDGILYDPPTFVALG